jgi:hypothetical protein
MTFLARLVLIVVGLASAVFGAHGLVVYFGGLEALLKNPQDLFLEIEVPEAFRGAIEWMWYRGIESWVIPAVFIAIGIVFLFLVSKITAAKK